MDKTTEVPSLSSLSIVNLSLEETSWPEDDAGGTEAAKPLWRLGAVDTSQAIEHASQVRESSALMNWIQSHASSKDTETSDLPISIYDDDESSRSVIADDDGGQAIVIDSPDEEMDVNDGHRHQHFLLRAHRKQGALRSPAMVYWRSKEYETRSAASLIAAREKMGRQRLVRGLRKALWRLKEAEKKHQHCGCYES